MKFIHTADLHLDSPFQGLKNTPAWLRDQIINSTFEAFRRIVTAAIEQQVDFLVIAGDIYDRDEHSIQAENFFIEQCERLSQEKIAVYLSYGNHDYQTVNLAHSLLPANVHVFGNQIETKSMVTNDGTRVALTGVSYETRWVNDDLAMDYPERAAVDLQIGILHGMLSGKQSQHANYAPFNLPELISKNYDYWALGHIHQREILAEHPWIIYSGNPQGRHKNETGAKGYYLVEQQNGQLVPQFFEIEAILWDKLEVELTDNITTKDLSHKILAQLKAMESATQQLVTIQLNGSLASNLQIQTEIDSGLLLNVLQRNSKLVWPVQISLHEQNDLPNSIGMDYQYWNQAADEVFRRDNYTELADKLFNYQFISDELNQTEQLAEFKSQILTDFRIKEALENED